MADRTAETTEKKRALDLALSQIEKQYGKGAIMKLGTAEAAADIPAIPTGSLGLGYCARRRRSAARESHRDFWPGSVG